MRDHTDIASWLPWWGAAIAGAVSFVILYFAMPAWLSSISTDMEGNQFKGIVDQLVGRRVWLFHWLGIAAALVGGYFAVRNYFIQHRAERREKRAVSWLSRFLARWLD
jgi:hypothetical protein